MRFARGGWKWCAGGVQDLRAQIRQAFWGHDAPTLTRMANAVESEIRRWFDGGGRRDHT